MHEQVVGFILDSLCMICSIITVIYIYKLRRIVGGNVVTLLLVGFGINMSFRVGYLLGYNMHGYFVFSYLFITIGFITLFHQVRGVIHSPIREAKAIFARAEASYSRAEDAHKKAGEVLNKAREAFEAVGAVNSEIKKIYFTDESK